MHDIRCGHCSRKLGEGEYVSLARSAVLADRGVRSRRFAINAVYVSGVSISLAGLALANHSSVSSGLSGSAAMPALMAAASSGVGMIVPDLSFGIIFHLSWIGLAQADDAYSVGAKTINHYVQTVANVVIVQCRARPQTMKIGP